MSEPTSGGTQKPDPDPDGSPGQDQNDVQDAPPDSVFSDPTAPVWADPTAPMPALPTPPSATQAEDEQPAASSQPTPPVAPPLSNPYAQQPAQPHGGQPPPPLPYGQQPYAQQPYSQQSYSQQQPGTQYPAYGQQTYPTGAQTDTNGSAIVLTILSGIFMLSTCFTVGIPSLVFGIMALTSNSTDPAGSRKKTKTGWILFGINFGVVVLLAIVAFGLLIATGNNISDNNSFNY